jgi:hypothetical protein
MIRKILITAEGICDAQFISELIVWLIQSESEIALPEVNLTEEKFIKIVWKDFLEVKILYIKGIGNLKNHAPTIFEHSINGYSSIIILDTDTKSVHKASFGGRVPRLKMIDDFLANNNITSQKFLFPFDNHIEGNIEDLLIKIVTEENFSQFYKFYSLYCKGISTLVENSPGAKELIEDKNVIHSFCSVFHGNEMAKPGKRNYRDERLWNLKSENLDTLLNLLRRSLFH